METDKSGFGHLDVGSVLLEAGVMESRWNALTDTAVGALQQVHSWRTVESAFGRMGISSSSPETGSWRCDLGQLSKRALGFDERLLQSTGMYAEHLQSNIDALARLGTATWSRVDPTDLLDLEHFNVLIANGWCVPLNAAEGDVLAAAEQFAHDRAGADERMCHLVRDHIDGIEEQVVQEFPHREMILREAFTAHRQRMFNLSVPVFIAQTDGFWLERCEHNLFGDNITKAIEAAQGKRVRGGIIERLLQSLTHSEWKLRQSRKKRAAGFSDLNRHQVLHGEVTNYGTEENSLKAIALLHFSSVILPSPEE